MGDIEITRFGGPHETPNTTTQNGNTPINNNDNRSPKQGRKLSYSDIALRITNTGSLAGMYAMLISSIAVVLTLAMVLSGSMRSSNKGIIIFCFHMYVYVMAFLFLIFLEVSIRSFKRHQAKNPDNSVPCVKLHSEDSGALSSYSSETYLVYPKGGTQKNDHVERTKEAPISDIQKETIIIDDQSDDINYESVMKLLQRFPRFQFTGEGVNLFARMGVIAFGLAAVLLDGFRLLMMSEAPNAFNCYGILSIIPTAARMLFTFLQIFSLFKNHKVLINYRHVLVKFGLLHVAAANICTWILTLVLEAQQAFNISKHNPISNSTQQNGSILFVTDSFDTSGGRRNIHNCYRRSTLYDEASPYLYPFVIEFSLLAAALFYQLYRNIGMTTVCPSGESPWQHNAPSNDEGRCHKANTGLFLGLAFFMCIGVAMCSFIYLLSKGGMSSLTTNIYLISDITANSLGLIAIIPSFYQFSKLHFTGILDDVLGQNMLIVALSGVYILSGFLGFAAGLQIYQEGETGIQARLQLASVVVSCLQATLQAVFIVDALRRQARDPEHVENKPGRSCVTFLLIVNLAMWLVNTFQLKELHHVNIFTSVYGKLAWTIIMHIFLPLTAFFRFHASVCLSDIWEMTYARTHTHTVHMLTLISNSNQKQD